MIPKNTETPLRKSEISQSQEKISIVNDDEEERRQSRRRTEYEESTVSGNFEDNETLKKCLQIYNENKLCKENAWSVSLIDTLSNLLDKHHKSLNNFAVAGSSLEASTKVYGLRVDSVHRDVVRMTTGLNMQQCNEGEKNEDSAMDIEPKPDSGKEEKQQIQSEKIEKPKKRVRKLISTVTKNKDTINAKLETYPFIDPIFAKLNATSGSINSSSRLLQNILTSSNSELEIRMDKLFWDSKPQELPDSSFENNYNDLKTADASELLKIKLDSYILRPNLSGYVISDTPAEQDEPAGNCPDSDSDRNSHMALAFDMNIDVEPVNLNVDNFIDVDEFDELTREEQAAVTNCRGLRRAPIKIEDMRPLDSRSSSLEYSYRPLDKISQFWAGPSHWKFRKSNRDTVSSRQPLSKNQINDNSGKSLNQLQRRKPLRVRHGFIDFNESKDSLFQKLSLNDKIRKANIQKKWDAKKLKLPTDYQIDRNIFDIFQYAAGISACEIIEETVSLDIPTQSHYNYDNPGDQDYCTNITDNDDNTDTEPTASGSQDENQSIEIGSEFIGAPEKITKNVVPFAKRAKVIDMKQLKKCCTLLIKNQFRSIEKENLPEQSYVEGDSYKKGVAVFSKIYNSLPEILTTNMAEALSPSVAFYSILHLANELNLRLVPRDDLTDFMIFELEDRS